MDLESLCIFDVDYTENKSDVTKLPFDDCYKGIVGKICQALEVMAWEANTSGYCEALLCNVKFYYIGFALDIL